MVEYNIIVLTNARIIEFEADTLDIWLADQLNRAIYSSTPYYNVNDTTSSHIPVSSPQMISS